MSELVASMMLNAGLFAALLLMQSLVRVFTQGPVYALSNFDVLREDGMIGARLARAKNNQFEVIALLIALSVIVETETAPAGASVALWVFNLARVGYVGTVLAGIPVLRSIIWMTGFLALAYAAWHLLVPAAMSAAHKSWPQGAGTPCGRDRSVTEIRDYFLAPTCFRNVSI